MRQRAEGCGVRVGSSDDRNFPKGFSFEIGGVL
jgi:hypothetical protein